MIELADAAATERFGRRLAPELQPGDVVALSGPLGSGKTTLARGLLRGLGHVGDAASPTFAIVQPYGPPETRIHVWHIDLYRIENPEELDELGLDDALIESALVIEWPERLPQLWPHALRLSLAPVLHGGRALTASVPAAWEARWPPR